MPFIAIFGIIAIVIVILIIIMREVSVRRNPLHGIFSIWLVDGDEETIVQTVQLDRFGRNHLRITNSIQSIPIKHVTIRNSGDREQNKITLESVTMRRGTFPHKLPLQMLLGDELTIYDAQNPKTYLLRYQQSFM